MGMSFFLSLFMPPCGGFLLITDRAEPSGVVQWQGGAALLTKTDVVAKIVQQDLVDLVCNAFPFIVEIIRIDRAAKGLAE